ncbi:hypothetical protein L7F22_056343 [Adiantum nelumboides]|nr:hypothetical protein [Adiantum nelumboides]
MNNLMTGKQLKVPSTDAVSTDDEWQDGMDLRITVKLKDHNINALVDTGARMNAVSYSTYRKATDQPLQPAGSSLHGCVEAHQATLERRIEEVKEKMRSKALQEIIYALAAFRMLYAMLARLQEHPCHRLDPMLAISELIIQQEDTLVSQQSGHCYELDDRTLQAIHAPEVQGLAARHVAMVICGKGQASLPTLELNVFVHVHRFEMGKMYAASVMHGYFLARLHQRFQLDRRLALVNTSSCIGASMQREMRHVNYGFRRPVSLPLQAHG